MDSDFLRDLVLNVREPVVIRGFDIPWRCAKVSQMEWLAEMHEKFPNPEFEVADQKHGNSPQFERFRKVNRDLNFGNFLEYSRSKAQDEKWASFAYKAIKDIPGVSPINFSFCGFPEISEEITMWLGSAGAHTSCHYDTYGRNVVVQVQGRKRWIMFSPEATDEMRPTRIPYEESSVYSEWPFFSPKSEADFSDILKYAVVYDLDPGDVLLVPPQWWHYVEALDNSLSFNAWIPIVSVFPVDP